MKSSSRQQIEDVEFEKVNSAAQTTDLEIPTFAPIPPPLKEYPPMIKLDSFTAEEFAESLTVFYEKKE